MVFEFKGIPIFYTDEGNGKVVLLLHGFLENSSMWNALLPEFLKNHRIITIDLLGHGQTGCLGYVHTMERMAEVVDAVLTHLKVEKVTIIGHSMGGYVALALAESTSKTIEGLCLMNSTSQADSEERKLNRDRAIAVVKQSHEAFISMSVSNLFSPDNRDRLAEDIENTKKEALKTPLQGIIAALEGMKIRKDRTFLLSKLPYKRLLVAGKKDPVLDFQSLIELMRDLDIEIVEFPDGHMSHVENKSELSYKLLHFIEK